MAAAAGAAAGAAFQAIAFLSGLTLGILPLVLPPPEIPTSPLTQGHSLVRFGIGMNATSSETLGGTIPSVQVWNEEGVYIGKAASSPKSKIEAGTFKTVTVYHNDSYKFQQPTYVAIAGGSDAVCLAYIAQAWPDGTQLGWLGDMGRYCGAPWYFSNLYVNTKNGTTYKVSRVPHAAAERKARKKHKAARSAAAFSVRTRELTTGEHAAGLHLDRRHPPRDLQRPRGRHEQHRRRHVPGVVRHLHLLGLQAAHG